jgi:hypothetical protein
MVCDDEKFVHEFVMEGLIIKGMGQVLPFTI